MTKVIKSRKLPPPSPLAKAIGMKDIKKVEELLRDGANVNQNEGDGIDALGLAAILGHTRIAQLLLDNGANINAVGNDTTPLMKAVLMNKTDTARLLIERGADVNVATDHGLTALIYSVQQGNMEIMQLLLENGADVSPREYRGHTARSLAEDWKREKMVPLLKEAERVQQCRATAIQKQQRLNSVASKSGMIRRPKPC